MTVSDGQTTQSARASRTLMGAAHRRSPLRPPEAVGKRPCMPTLASSDLLNVHAAGAHGQSDQVAPAGAIFGKLPMASRPTLLIVDDQPINIQALYHALKHDYQLLMATNGLQGIELCRSANPDLVLLDVVMPGMDGYDVCRRLKSDEATSRIPIIFVTASATSRDERKCLEAGAVDFISKPVNPAVLQSRVRTHLTLKHQADLLRQSSEELVSAQRLGKVGSWHWDLQADRLEMSEQLRRMLAVEHLPAGHAARCVRAHFSSGSWRRGLMAVARARSGESTDNLELAHRRSDGTMAHLLCNIEALVNEAREVIAVRCTVLDITDRVRAEQLRIAKEAAELANGHKTRFLSSMSHELRTPLNAVLGFAQLLSREASIQRDSGLQTKVGHIMDAGRHLLSMVAEILDLASIDAGKVVLTMAPVDGGQVMRDSLEMTEPEALSRSLDMRPLVSQGPVWVQADPRRLRQILLNLLSNAIKYNRLGGEIHASICSTDEHVLFAVSDTGAGLSPEQVSHLFEPFNRLGAENSSAQGTGIGLVLCRHLAQAMGGRIEVSSVPGTGSTFTLCLRKAMPPDGPLNGEAV